MSNPYGGADSWKNRALVAEAQVNGIATMANSLMGSRIGHPYALAMIKVLNEIRTKTESKLR